MENRLTRFNDVTLLITHFNRCKSLERLLNTLNDFKLSFHEIIVSDGGSELANLKEVRNLKKKYNFTLLTTEINLGMGNSINVGLDIVTTPYTLYIQEDFVPKPAFVNALSDGLQLMKDESEWDIVRFYSFPWAKFPYLESYKKGFSKMLFSLFPWYIDHHKFYVYSDHPHLQRKNFAEKFGRYLEVMSGDKTELTMCRSFLKNRGKGLYYENYKDLFDHANSYEEPGQVRLDKIKTKKYSDIAPLYWAYLKYKTFKETVSYVLDK